MSEPTISTSAYYENSLTNMARRGWDFLESISKAGEPEHDPVNQPSHYTSDPSGIECIEITQHRNFCIGNAIKYLWRAGLKDDAEIQDLRKAIWYINQEIIRLGGKP